jgi:hypothetical protein
MTDQEPIAAAILTALNAALPSWADAYDTDGVPGAIGSSVPGPMPASWVVIRLYRIKTGSARGGGAYMVPGFFLDTGYRAQNVTTCRELRRIVSAALENQVVGAYGPFVFNDESQPIADDPDWTFFGVDTWSFC